jgi:biopolymer transport protein ExbB
MKKIISYLSLTLFLSTAFLMPQVAFSQAAAVEAIEALEAADAEESNEEVLPESEAPGFTEKAKDIFIDGGLEFMVPILLCLIFGVSIAIERVIYLSASTVNTKKLLAEIESALNSGGIEAAKTVCQNTRGPVGSIFFEGLSRANEGSEAVERAIIAGGSVQMGLMEKGTSWISLFIALGPMLGFLGTVYGMIGAFDAIQEAGGIKPTVVAGGIKVALITTVGGLIVAIILQIFMNYILSKIDSLVNTMEDASNTFVKMVKTKLS